MYLRQRDGNMETNLDSYCGILVMTPQNPRCEREWRRKDKYTRYVIWALNWIYIAIVSYENIRLRFTNAKWNTAKKWKQRYYVDKLDMAYWWLWRKKEKLKIIECPMANDFSRSWHNFSRLISPTFRVMAESYREKGGLD